MLNSYFKRLVQALKPALWKQFRFFKLHFKGRLIEPVPRLFTDQLYKLSDSKISFFLYSTLLSCVKIFSLTKPSINNQLSSNSRKQLNKLIEILVAILQLAKERLLYLKTSYKHQITSKALENQTLSGDYIMLLLLHLYTDRLVCRVNSIRFARKKRKIRSMSKRIRMTKCKSQRMEQLFATNTVLLKTKHVILNFFFFY